MEASRPQPKEPISIFSRLGDAVCEAGSAFPWNMSRFRLGRMSACLSICKHRRFIFDLCDRTKGVGSGREHSLGALEGSEEELKPAVSLATKERKEVRQIVTSNEEGGEMDRQALLFVRVCAEDSGGPRKANTGAACACGEEEE